MDARPELLKRLQIELARACPPERLAIASVEIFRGPNIHAPAQAILLQLQSGGAADFSTARETIERDFPIFVNERPGGNGDASRDAPALLAVQLARRLIASELQFELRCGDAGCHGITSRAWIEFVHPNPVLQALALALAAVGAALDGGLPAHERQGQLGLIAESCRQYGPNFDSLVLINAARARGIPFLQLVDNHVLWQFGWGRRSVLFWMTSSNLDGVVAHRLASNKELTKKWFHQLGIPTPRGRLLRPGENARRAAQAIGWPCVVKPVTSNGGGAGVTANISDEQTLDRAVADARALSAAVIIEAHEPGDDHRLMVIDGRLAAAVRRDPPFVIGDGQSTVSTLLGAFNAGRQGTFRETGFLVPVRDDNALALALAGQGLSNASIPAEGRRVLLRSNANRSSGGSCTDVLAKVHPQVKALAEQIALALGYHTTGLDYVTTDISRSHDDVGGAFLEANSIPGILALLASGMTEDEVGGLVIGPTPARVPTVLLLVPEEEAEAAAGLLRQALGPGDGAAGRGWACIGAWTLPDTTMDPAVRAESLLRYPSVERLILLWSEAELYRHGLAVDRVDQAIIAGVEPSKDILALVDRHSGQLVSAASAAEAITMLFGDSAAPDRMKPPKKVQRRRASVAAERQG